MRVLLDQVAAFMGATCVPERSVGEGQCPNSRAKPSVARRYHVRDKAVVEFFSTVVSSCSWSSWKLWIALVEDTDL